MRWKKIISKSRKVNKVFKSLFPVQLRLSQWLLGTTEFASKPQPSKRGKSRNNGLGRLLAYSLRIPSSAMVIFPSFIKRPIPRLKAFLLI